MDNKLCSTYCFNNGECTLCSEQNPSIETKCLRCRCPREWAGDRCETKIKLSSTSLKRKPQEIPIGIMIGLFTTCIMLLIIFFMIKYKVIENLWTKIKLYCSRNSPIKKDFTSFSYATYVNDESVII
uniref:EGF-like domain-containing protein n=1 Tax=Schistosoma mansoni TaxID=6183 RepID=A0A5K4FAR1_SCHMA